MNDVVIVSARRTPFGKFLGALASRSAIDLAIQAGEAALEGIDREKIDQVILGNVLSAGQGMNMARQVGVGLSLPLSVPAFTLNMMCASGLHSISLAASLIQSGGARAILCGGSESMSQAPHLLPRSRTGIALGDGKLVDSLLRDGLVDSFNHKHMGLTAEALAERYAISREDQDAYAALSQQRVEAAHESGAFAAELVPLTELSRDEHPRSGTTAESLAKLKPVFSETGTVSAGNASGINDGAALLLVAERTYAESQDWPILAQITGQAAVGCDPETMGLGPVFAIRQLLQQLETALEDFDTIEINEAFAAQVLACLAELKLPPERINPQGGAIAIGHPIGASGARLVTHLAHGIHAGATESALASLCVGGGMGVAMSLRKGT